MSATAAQRRRLLIPEVIQSSMMDCGPASLKALLDGFHLAVDYGRLREACSTDVDGTSIDTLEDVAVELGMAAEQVMIPLDHLLIRESEVTPAILVVMRPHMPTHYIVLWRVHAGFVQIMDPAVGRQWISHQALLRDVYVHEMPVSASDWRAWASSETFQTPLLRRLRNLGLDAARARGLVAAAERDQTWESLGTLDAATRMLDRLATHGGLRSGDRVSDLLERLSAEGAEGRNIPEGFWSVRRTSPGPDGEERVLNRGAVLVRVGGRAGDSERRPTQVSASLAPELLAALKAPSAAAWAPLRVALGSMGLSTLGFVLPALVMAAAMVSVQAVLLRSVLDLGYWLGIGQHRLGAGAALALFVVAALVLDVPITLALSRLGRRLEVFFRVAFARKMPRIADHYFHSRLLSDMAERLHAIATLRALPGLLGSWTKTAFLLLFTAGGIIWLAPWLAGWVMATVVLAIVLSLATVSVLQEREMRMRSHGGALVRFYLDALLGIACVRAHGAGPSMLREQESLLVHWSGANRRLQVATVAIELVQSLVGVGLAVGLVMTHVARHGTSGSVLLVTYWALQIPVLAQSLAVAARQLPPIRNAVTRVLEPLNAPEETESDETAESTDTTNGASGQRSSELPKGGHPLPADGRGALTSTSPQRRGVRIEMTGVEVRAGGHAVLEDIHLSIEPGSQVAIVGESGAGKSTLVGLLLGWHRSSSGTIRLDGEPLLPRDLARWRLRTAWVDPAVQLYNRRFVQNLLYGSEEGVADIASAIEQADLREVLERLPEGLQTVLGEGGALLSGGEGQRVRLGRAWLRRDVRMVLLDEPFRGLDREKRHLLLERARRFWGGATVLCVTHDVGETLDFERVIVIHGGRVVEDGSPRELAAAEGSAYQRMVVAERLVRETVWGHPQWRRFRVENGAISECREQAPEALAELAGIDSPDLVRRDD